MTGRQGCLPGGVASVCGLFGGWLERLGSVWAGVEEDGWWGRLGGGIVSNGSRGGWADGGAHRERVGGWRAAGPLRWCWRDR